MNKLKLNQQFDYVGDFYNGIAVVLDKDKAFYMRGLKEYNNDKMFLIDTIKNEQDIFENVCNELLNFEI